jgi:hypothetical protein
MLLRNGASQSIEFGVAALLRQDQRFTPSREIGFRRRACSALHSSFFVPGGQGDELALPRLAAAFVTPWATRSAWRETAPSPLAQTGFLLGRYVLRSYWTEFQPDVTRVFHRTLRRLRP